jgi:hypothetical protein
MKEICRSISSSSIWINHFRDVEKDDARETRGRFDLDKTEKYDEFASTVLWGPPVASTSVAVQ